MTVQSNDSALVERAAGGDRSAQRELFEMYREAAYAVALRVTGRHDDALDVAQDAFIKAFEGLHEFQRESGFKTWLLRICTNRALDLLRSRKVRLAVSVDAQAEDGSPGNAAIPSGDAAPDERIEQSETADRIRRALEELPPQQRAAFALFASGELSYGEIAAALDVPIGTVMSRLYHARRKLFELLGDLAPRGFSVSEDSESR